MYTNIKVNVSDLQKDKIRHAFQNGTGVSIKLSHADLSGEPQQHVLALTQAQIKKIAKAYQNGTGAIIKMSKTQLDYNMKVEGGFLPALLGLLGSTVAPFLIKTALPALATGALSGLASTGVSKALGASGGTLYVKRGQNGFKVVPAGKGLYLSPWKKGSSIAASGLYMKRGSGYVETSGEGFLLGPDSPFKNIPILGWLL